MLLSAAFVKVLARPAGYLPFDSERLFPAGEDDPDQLRMYIWYCRAVHISTGDLALAEWHLEGMSK